MSEMLLMGYRSQARIHERELMRRDMSRCLHVILGII